MSLTAESNIQEPEDSGNEAIGPLIVSGYDGNGLDAKRNFISPELKKRCLLICALALEAPRNESPFVLSQKVLI